MAEISVAADMLQSFVRRIESLDDEILALNADKSEVYKELKGQGFDAKVLRKLIADRRKDASERAEFETIYELYAEALGMRLYRDEGDKPTLVRAHVETIDEFPVGHDEDGVFPDDETLPAPAAQMPVAETVVADVPVKVAVPTSAAGQEGIVDRQLIQPEMANEAAGDTGHAKPDAADHGTADDEAANTGGLNVAVPGAHQAEGEGANNAASATITQLRQPKPFRPNCLNRDKCGGQGPVECWQCTKAAAANRGATA